MVERDTTLTRADFPLTTPPTMVDRTANLSIDSTALHLTRTERARVLAALRSNATYARTYANGEVYHYLRDKSFLIKVPASWRELHARGQKLLRLGTAASDVPHCLGVSVERWREIVQACEQRVVAFEVRED